MTHLLDRPAWNALRSAHASLGEGSARARRYYPRAVPFAAAADNALESLAALSRLPAAGEKMVLLEQGAISVPAGLEIVSECLAVQMIADQTYERLDDPVVQALGEADAADMLTLALLTKPGPFTLYAQDLGQFWGIRVDGELVAMAGQRIRVTGFTEISGLCVHPNFQGLGFGTLLFRFVAGEIGATGSTPYLHAYASNTGAISLYKRLGFTERATLNLCVVQRAF